MRRSTWLILALVASLVLAGCPQDGGSRRASGTTTTRRAASTTSTTAPGSSPATPGGPDPVPPPDDLPRAVLLGGAKLTSVDLASGRPTDIPNPRLENGLQVTGLLNRAFGAMVLVRGPLPQDAGAVYVLNDNEHLPRSLGTGVRAVAGGAVGEAWVVGAGSPDAVSEVRRVDLGREVPALAQSVVPGRSLAGVGAGGLVVTPAERSGRVDLVDPVKGSTTRSLAANGAFLGADGQRAVVLQDVACPTTCSVLVAGPAGDRTWPLPAGLRPEAGAAAVASGAVLLVARQASGPRHLYVLDLTSGEVKDALVDLPPEAGPPPMATDAQGRWAFTRIGPAQLVGVRLATAEPVRFPFELEPWGAIAVTAGGACACGGGGGGGGPTV
ncbi:MAG: hypothetical protein ABIS47_11930 [Acidimicrobiales bacterium]